MAEESEMRAKMRASEWPWERTRNPETIIPDDDLFCENYQNTKFVTRGYENKYLDMDTKIAAIKASASVASLITYSDDKEISKGAGTIIDEDGTILTSFELFRCPTRENVVANGLKVVVHLQDGKSYEAELSAYTFYYGIAVVKIREKVFPKLKPACCRHVDDCFSLELPVHVDTGSQLRLHSNGYRLVPGDKVIALGRYYLKPYSLMVAPGEFSMNRIKDRFECKDLFRATCLITETGIGGPLVNCHGEVIGVASFDFFSTPFLPINIALKWWEHHEKNKNLHRRLLLGLEVANLYTSDVQVLEKVIYKSPNNFAGVIVEEVKQGSCADKAGIRPNDVIVECCGKTIRSFLEWFDIISDNIGNSLKLVVVRARKNARLELTMAIVDAATKSKKRKRSKKSKRSMNSTRS